MFFLITYSAHRKSHHRSSIFFSTTGTLGMIAHLSIREPTVSLSHTSSMEYLYVLSDEGKNNILKKLDCFYLHINVQYINRVQ